MDRWQMNLGGVGPQGTGASSDADQIFKRLVQDLRAGGHQIDSQNFTITRLLTEADIAEPTVTAPTLSATTAPPAATSAAGA